MLLALSLAFASPMITAVSAPTPLPVGGGWSRAFPHGDGSWDFVWASGGDYNVGRLGSDLVLDYTSRRALTGHVDLVDNLLVACPDGSYLHLASSNGKYRDNTAWLFRYDATWTKTFEQLLVDNSPELVTNDAALLCRGGDLDLAGVVVRDSNSVLLKLTPPGGEPGRVDLNAFPKFTGGLLAEDKRSHELVAVGGLDKRSVYLTRFSPTDFTAIETRQLPLGVGQESPYWTQGMVRVRDHWVLLYMSRDLTAGWDVDYGNVRLAVLDESWNVIEDVAVTTFVPPIGAQRPSLAFDGERMLVLYDYDVIPQVVTVTLDLDLFGSAEVPDTGPVTGDDTATTPGDDTSGTTVTDTDTPGDDTQGEEDPKPTDTATGCGCATAPDGAAGVLGMAVAALVTARRRSPKR